MMDFQIKRTGRRCHESEREFKAGEWFYSDLIQDDDELVRRDFGEDVWKGPHEQSIGWWRSRIPEVDGGKVYWAPKDVLISYFDTLHQQEKRKAYAYVMSLLLVRKRILRLVDSVIENEVECLEVRLDKEKRTWIVPVVQLSATQVNEIQTELAQQLFMDQPPD